MTPALPSSRLAVATLALITCLTAAEAGTGQVRIEGDQVRINVGSMDGYGVMSALRRHDLVERRQRTLGYEKELERLGPRMRNAQVIVGDHPGGLLKGIAADVSDINALGLPVRIIGRYCHSACTLFLGADRVCVSPKTRFGFHRPGNKPGAAPISAAGLRAAIKMAGTHYRPGLRDWWERQGSRSRRLKELRGRDLIRMGYRSCENDKGD